MLLVTILGLVAAAALLNALTGDAPPVTARLLSAATLLAGLAATLFALATASAPITLVLPWMPSLHADFTLVADGPGLALLVLGFVVGLVAVGVSVHESRPREGLYQANLLLALLGAQGCFLAGDALTFFLFFELMLVPGWYIVRAAGDAASRKAATRFFLFTQGGGLLLLLGILALSMQGNQAAPFAWTSLGEMPPPAWAAALVVLGLGVKLPIVPLHSWLADTYTRGPLSSTVIFAGILSKAGAFGLWRAAEAISGSMLAVNILAICGVIGVLYGAALAFSSTDIKRIVAYSSMSHLGYVALAIASHNDTAMQGALVLMIAHGLTVAGFFAAISALAARTGTTDLARMGGLWADAPKLSFVTMLFALGSIGLPGFVGFAGEMITLLGVFAVWPKLAMLAQIGVLGATLYATHAVHHAFMGPKGKTAISHDLSNAELAGLAALGLAILALGIWPAPLLSLFAAI